MPLVSATSILFGLFLVLIFSFLLRANAVKVWALIVASVVFYASFGFRYVPLLLGVTFLNFGLALLVKKASKNHLRKTIFLSLAVFFNVGVIFIFKLSERVATPPGLSFYTIQALTYVIDAYKGDPVAGIREYLAGVTFFPKLIAGPVARTGELLPQFKKLKKIDWSEVQESVLLIAVGFCKRGLGEQLLVHSDALFNTPGPHSTLDSWAGVLASFGQVYCALAGYTDIALGVALFLGVRLPRNFNLPFLATSPIDFWHRWHISLSSWFRDYVYFPISIFFTRINIPAGPSFALLCSMTLFGIWTGIKGTYVMWGLSQTILILGSRWIGEKTPEALAGKPALRLLQIALTFYLMHLSLIFVRVDNLGSAWQLLREMHGITAAQGGPALISLPAVLFFLLSSYVLSYAHEKGKFNFSRPVFTWLVSGVLLALAVSLGGANHESIYAHF